MKTFWLVGVVMTTLALGGCLNVRPGQPVEPDMISARDPAKGIFFADGEMSRSIHPKHEYRYAINKEFEEQMFNLRLRFEKRKITFEQLSREGNEIEARKAERLKELDKAFGVSPPLTRAMTCETTGRTTFCH